VEQRSASLVDARTSGDMKTNSTAALEGRT
jgi:hypothetical protein